MNTQDLVHIVIKKKNDLIHIQKKNDNHINETDTI